MFPVPWPVEEKVLCMNDWQLCPLKPSQDTFRGSFPHAPQVEPPRVLLSGRLSHRFQGKAAGRAVPIRPLQGPHRQGPPGTTSISQNLFQANTGLKVRQHLHPESRMAALDQTLHCVSDLCHVAMGCPGVRWGGQTFRRLPC